MPVASLVRPILLTSSIVIGASVALYETNPHIRHLVDTAALKLSNVFQDILSAIDEGLRNLTPEQREEHRRRQREHVAMVAMSGRGNDAGTETAVALRRNAPSLHRDTSSRNGPALTREALDINTTAQEGASAVSGREELRAKRRRLWELAQAAPLIPTNDSAVEITPLMPERPKDDETNTQEPPKEQASQPWEPLQDEAATTAVLFEHENSNEAAQPNKDNDVVSVSSDGSHSLIPTPQYSPSLSATSWSQPPSPAPEDLVDTLSSMDEDDGASTDTETMSHVSGYSFSSNAQSGFGENDVISLASSDAGDLERER